GSLTITVTVTVNGAPVGDDIGTTTGADAPVTVDILAGVSDPDGDLLVIDSTTTPANGTVAVSGGSVTYTPDAGFDGEDTFDVIVTDGNGGTATITVTITVAAAQRIFVAADACIAIKVLAFSAGYTSQIWLMGPDGPRYLGVTNQNVNQQVTVGFYPAGTTLDFGIKVQQTGYTFVTGAASANPDNLVHAQVNAGSGSVLYVVGFEDLYGGGDQDYDDVVFQVIDIPCVVEASNDTATTTGGTPVTVNVLDNDTSTAGSLAVTSVTAPSNGTATTDGTTVEYTPNTGFTGTDTFTYTVTDASGATDTATVTVTVPSALEAVDDAAVTPKNKAVT
ncbi:MAG: Ig-like domain-containing protein, partial [Dehalococcoidia bacterium]|nr:Ig-like domain-containing protein [Dehalococcoidia bacterium]